MNFASRALNKMGSFIKNQRTIFALGTTMLMAGATQAQTIGTRLAPKPKADTTKAISVAPAAATSGANTATLRQPVAKKEKKEKIDRSDRPDNGFTTFNIGATYTPKSSLWTSGTQFNWHGNVALGRPNSWAHRNMQLRAGFTLRDKKQQFGYNYRTYSGTGVGGYYYKPSEVDAHILIGPKFAMQNKNDDRYNTAIIMPYVGVGGSYGWASSTNDVTYLSPEVVYGANVLIGKIGKEDRDKDGEGFLKGSTLAVNLFAEGRYQVLNTTSVGGQLVNYYFPPNAGPNNRNTFRLGVSLALCRN